MEQLQLIKIPIIMVIKGQQFLLLVSQRNFYRKSNCKFEKYSYYKEEKMMILFNLLIILPIQVVSLETDML